MMQILQIALYGINGQVRILNFDPGKVNIITGGSDTGKSALIDIIEYCIGRDDCSVADGIRQVVSWFGVRLQLPSEQIFVARQCPPIGQNTVNRAYIEIGDVVECPSAAPSQQNSTFDGVVEYLSARLGIASNEFISASGNIQTKFSATAKHALFYCFQGQSEIANKDYLFHRQSMVFIKQAIVASLPYFLGAIQEDRLAKEKSLVRARQQLKKDLQKLQDYLAIRDRGTSNLLGLIAEATEVGLLRSDEIPDKTEDIIPLLQHLMAWTPTEAVFTGSDRLTQLQQEVASLRLRWSEISDAIREAKIFAQESEGYTSEARQQQIRLESIGILDPTNEATDTCPICTQQLHTPMPTISAMQRSLIQLRSSLETTSRERPRIREYIEKLENERGEIKDAIQNRTEAINGVLRGQDAAAQIRDLNVRRAMVIGRIGLWLESIRMTDNTALLEENVRKARLNVEDIESTLNEDEKNERLTRILNRMGVQMTAWARELELEYRGNPIRLDARNVTVVADLEDREVPLSRMGSGKNWIGYHLIALLAIHHHFRQQNRPVPAFLFLDQPTQVYYPSELDKEFGGNIQPLTDEDKRAVRQMFDLIFEVVESLSPDFQVIVLDHADLEDNRFQSAVKERWRKGEALIPQNWFESRS